MPGKPPEGVRSSVPKVMGRDMIQEAQEAAKVAKKGVWGESQNDFARKNTLKLVNAKDPGGEVAKAQGIRECFDLTAT